MYRRKSNWITPPLCLTKNEHAEALLMLRSIGFALVLACGSITISNAKDMFDVYGMKGTEPVRLHAMITSQYDNGFIREASNFDNGQWDIGPEIPCGDSQRFFEVWSRASTISPPGIAFEKMQVVFSLTHAVDVKAIKVERGIKGTFKHGSHFKGEDFGLRVHLACK